MTNEHLSRLAAERLGNEGQLRGTEAFAASIIAEVYAEAMTEREQNTACRLLVEMLQQCCKDFIDHDIHCDTPRDVQIDSLLSMYQKQAMRIKELEAQAVQDWPRCDERLPDVDEPVWAWDGERMLILVLSVMSDGEEQMAVWCNTYYRVSWVGGKFVADDAHYDDDYEPICWQPLPQPPEVTS